jgi:hypothetical protein
LNNLVLGENSSRLISINTSNNRCAICSGSNIILCDVGEHSNVEEPQTIDLNKFIKNDFEPKRIQHISLISDIALYVVFQIYLNIN